MLLLAVLAVALTLAGALMVGMLQRQLVGQIDRQLERSGYQLASQLGDERLSGQAALLPSEYYVQIDPMAGRSREFMTSSTEAQAGRPIVNLSAESLLDIVDGGPTGPYDVGSTLAGATWRAMSLPFAAAEDGRPTVLTVALPLVGVNETLSSTAFSFMVASISLMMIAWAGGRYLVKRSLRPLSDIETVAGAIAAGDLSQRIPNAPLSTEVGSLSASLNTMLVQIERSFATTEKSEQRMRTFVSDASHELRTPLAAIRGYAELYRMGAVDEDRIADVMSRIEAESTRMGTLVEDLLTLARLDEGPELRLEMVDLVELAAQSKSDLNAIDPTRHIKMVGTHGQRVPSSLCVRADRDQVMQIFLNLAGNIVRYTPAGSPVEIALGATGERAVVEFRDHGPGVPQEDRGRVFERFFRTGKSRSRELGGSGLGLSIVSSIVEGHGGEVSLWETDPHGLTVRVTLPIAGPADHAPSWQQDID